jgi:4-hydroxyphenylpyruvate dioxygenase
MLHVVNLVANEITVLPEIWDIAISPITANEEFLMSHTESELRPNASPTRDNVLGIDSVELYVGNIHQASHYFECKFGFEVHDSSAGNTQDDSVVLLGSGGARISLVNAVFDHSAKEYVHRHGDSIRDIVLRVRSVEAAFQRAIDNGAIPILEPSTTESHGKLVQRATVSTPGDIVHSLVREGDDLEIINNPQNGNFSSHGGGTGSLFNSIDHVALAVPEGESELWAQYYQSAFGLEITHREDTQTDLTAMRSIVVENGQHTVKFPIVEPAPGRKRSQVEEFVRNHNGSGVQHVAFLCDDIASTVRHLRDCGVAFITVVDSYYDLLPTRFPQQPEHFGLLHDLQLLIDRDEWGDLIQTFTKPITGKPTLFFELVQRNGARGFGGGNIKALFEAVEREQALRADW